MNEAPYKAPPKAPVLYIKPANTWSANGADIPVPARVPEVEVGATIAMVMKAPGEVAGYVLMNDLSVPHASFFRPPVKFKCLDGFLGVGARLLPADRASDPARFGLEVRINGELRQTVRFDHLVRDAPRLLADVGEFMTLEAGDVLMLGCDVGRPRAKVGDRDRAPRRRHGQPRATGWWRRRGMKHARVVHEGVTHDATERDGQLLLDDGRLVAFDAVTWLPPLAPTPQPRTILALGLNYADHAKELAFKAPEEPLVFLKGENALTGHRQSTRRPAGVEFMHYECELTVVIGKAAKHVKRADAYDFIAGYTVANDYAIRDYLENWYRPNLRVKNRDGATPLGPWLVDASDVPDPMALALRTTVNGKVTQSRATRGT